MYLVYILLTLVYCCSVVFIPANCLSDSEDNISLSDDKAEENLADENTFVALVDIVFTDGSKKTCTGSIIHDNVVITAAHCFINHERPEITSSPNGKRKMKHTSPELTASFVVIGTKKMFESGYEQYLPIERITTHPKYSGWTADLILVFTFAAMTSDKPGTVIPLARDNFFAPVDSNLTLYSWGRAMDITHTAAPHLDSEKGCSESKEDSDYKALRVGKSPNPGYISNESDQSKNKAYTFKVQQNRNNDEAKKRKIAEQLKYQQNQKRHNQMLRERIRKQLQPKKKMDAKEYIKQAFSKKTTKHMSRYLTDSNSVEMNEGRLARYRNPAGYNAKPKISYPSRTTKRLRFFRQQTQTKTSKSGYRSWRRQMGSQQNNLTVETFSFVNLQTCKKMVEKSMPAVYGIKDSNEIVCYSSERRYITIDDSGAPVVQQGFLVAVTVGGVIGQDEHVAVGMKMSCFCSWIAANLPGGGNHLQCCKDCCDVGHSDKVSHKRSHRYLRI